MATRAQREAEAVGWRASLGRLLSLAGDDEFLTMVWATHALQDGRADRARRFFRGLPEQAEQQGLLGPQAIYPWELETLVNELLTTPKHQLYRSLDCHSWQSVLSITGQLRQLENAEYGASRGARSAIREMGKIGARQFDWQRGFFTVPELYRGAFIYGQGECAAFLEQSVGISVEDLTLVGFALMSVFLEDPRLRPTNDLTLLSSFQLARASQETALAQIARPLADIKQAAVEIRGDGPQVAYRPSILRRFPCLLTGHRGRTMMAPLPELIANRVSAGLFYDVIGGGGPVRAEIGDRFERYSHEFLCAMFPQVTFNREWRYRTRLGNIDSPDILMRSADGAVAVAIECKAARMGIEARFGDDPDLGRGYEEIARGVFQLWRFFAHCRQGLTGSRTTIDCLGFLLTLDEWFAARSSHLDDVIARANSLADESNHDIRAEDRRPVAFCSISDLETVLATATEQSLIAALTEASGDRRGWLLSSLHANVDAPKVGPREYPFGEALNGLLPWYGRIEEIAEAEAG